MRGPVRAYVEGVVDEAVVAVLGHHVGAPAVTTHVCRGKQAIDRGLTKWRDAVAHGERVLVMRDLDRDACCAPALAAHLQPDAAHGPRLVLAVRSVEAWLLGDRESIASYLGVSLDLVPLTPEDERDPKATIGALAMRGRGSEAARRIAPTAGRAVGPGYTSAIETYIYDHWRPEVAAERCPSLRRCIERLRELAEGADT